MSSKKSNISKEREEKTHHVGVSSPTAGSEDQIRTLRIEALVAGGRGMGRDAGKVWFVPGTLPGDVVEAVSQRHRPGHVEALLRRVVAPSPERRDPPCPFQARCGGCPWMALPETLQGLWKIGLVRDALGRIGGLSAPPLDPLHSPVPALAYRNRAEFSLSIDPRARIIVGFHSLDRPRELVEVDRCAILEEAANRVLATAREHLSALRPTVSRRHRPSTEWRLIIRRSSHSGEIVVVLRETEAPFPGADELAALLSERHAEVSGVILARGQPGRRGGARVRTLRGRPWLEERAAGAVFRVPASSFLQVNAAALDALLGFVVECAGEVSGARILDLYGGVGVFGFELCTRGAREAVVCDADRDAIQSGRRAARRGRHSQLRFVHDTVGRFLSHRTEPEAKPDLIVANPPRSGLGRRVVRGILDRAPARIVLVSCDPATLARDLKWLIASGYNLDRVIPVDLFPQTAHVETVTRLSKS